MSQSQLQSVELIGSRVVVVRVVHLQGVLHRHLQHHHYYHDQDATSTLQNGIAIDRI
jgi:hypothetical protein